MIEKVIEHTHKIVPVDRIVHNSDTHYIQTVQYFCLAFNKPTDLRCLLSKPPTHINWINLNEFHHLFSSSIIFSFSFSFFLIYSGKTFNLSCCTELSSSQLSWMHSAVHCNSVVRSLSKSYILYIKSGLIAITVHYDFSNREIVITCKWSIRDFNRLWTNRISSDYVKCVYLKILFTFEIIRIIRMKMCGGLRLSSRSSNVVQANNIYCPHTESISTCNRLEESI